MRLAELQPQLNGAAERGREGEGRGIIERNIQAKRECETEKRFQQSRRQVRTGPPTSTIAKLISQPNDIHGIFRRQYL